MISSRKEEEKGSSNHNHNHASSSSGLSSWGRLKDPRIVRVSRAFGGKDRHSKVCTVRGLRDRRVRLSVPTAIQLYDLQDRLGLNQPSKVVDWLLNAAKNEIDELPPLQMPSGGISGNLIHDNHCLNNSVEPNPDWFNNLNKPVGIRDSFLQQQQEFMRWGGDSAANLSLAQSRMHDDDGDDDDDNGQNYNVLPFVVPSTPHVLLYQPTQSYLAENQNRIGRDFEPWFHLSTTPPPPPLQEGKNSINQSEMTVQPETNWPRL